MSAKKSFDPESYARGFKDGRSDVLEDLADVVDAADDEEEEAEEEDESEEADE